VSINDKPRIKLSQELEKLVLPGKKDVYRMFGADGFPLLDLLVQNKEEAPRANQRILVRHPFEENKRAYITPARVERVLQVSLNLRLKGLSLYTVGVFCHVERCIRQL